MNVYDKWERKRPWNILLYNLNMFLETLWKLRNYIRIVHLAGIKLVRSDVKGQIAPLSAV